MATLDTKGVGATAGEASTHTSLFFPNEIDWQPIEVGPNGEGGGKEYPDTILGTVDLQKYFHGAGQFKVFSHENFNLMYIKLTPNFTMPRHRHNIPQTVMVLEGTLYRGRRKFGPGDGYFSKADEIYTITSGDQGATYVEIRRDPLQNIETTWVEANPDKWVRTDT